MATLLPVLRTRFFDSNGVPLAGGKLWSYAAGTSTPQATYNDYTGLTPNTNPVILDANGEANVWVGALSYKFILMNSSDVVQFTIDNVTASSGSGATTGTSGITAFAGGGQASATALPSDINQVATVATAGDSVKLPAATPGKQVVVINDGANSCDIFPQSGEFIDDFAVNIQYPLAITAKNVRFICAVAGKWKSAAGGSSASNSVAASYNLTTAVSYTADAAIVCPTSVIDTNSAYNTTTGEFTVPVGEEGEYYVGAVWSLTAASNTYLKVNGTAKGYLSTNQASSTSFGARVLSLAAGDLVTWRSDASGTTLASGTNGSLVNVFIFKIGQISSGGGGGGGSGITRSIINLTSTLTAAAVALTDYVYLLGASAVLTMPTAVGNTNAYFIKNIDSSNKTISFTGGETGDGSSSLILTPNTALTLVSDNSNWRIL